jgi:hypothetical protein
MRCYGCASIVVIGIRWLRVHRNGILSKLFQQDFDRPFQLRSWPSRTALGSRSTSTSGETPLFSSSHLSLEVQKPRLGTGIHGRRETDSASLCKELVLPGSRFPGDLRLRVVLAGRVLPRVLFPCILLPSAAVRHPQRKPTSTPPLLGSRATACNKVSELPPIHARTF